MNDSPAWLAEFEPLKPLEELVVEINNLYHEFDAERYDREHPEIYDFLPGLWREMISLLPERRSWRVLDFGCGTGFEAGQILEGLGSRIESMCCYDPSPSMLDRCKLKLGDQEGRTLTSQWTEAQSKAPFNLLLTNSVLHHLPSVRPTLDALLQNLTSDAWWLAGHEPSSRYFRNPECMQLLNRYRRYRKWKRFIDPASYRSRLGSLLRPDPLRLTAAKAFAQGLFRVRPSPEAIDRIVDFRVPHSLEDAAAGRGLDFAQMEQDLSPEWDFVWVKTYFFLGLHRPNEAPNRWVERSLRLGRSFPLDGANFCSVWSRVGNREESS